jgi:HK97 family phage portal protein
MVANNFASLQPILMIDGVKITDHPLLDLLRRPSADFTGVLFQEVIAKDYLVTGETEIIALGNENGPPINIEPVSPKNVSITMDDKGRVGSFTVTQSSMGGAYEAERDSRDVRYINTRSRDTLKQIRNYSTKDNSLLNGQSLLVSASREASQHILGSDHNIALLENGGKATLVYNIEEDLDKDDFEATKDKVRSALSGTSNAGKVVITSGGKATISELGTSNRDMDFNKLQTAAKQSVALQYRVPLPLISIEASSFNNYQEAKLALYDDAIIPLADKLFGGLQDFLFPRFKLDPNKARLTYDPDQITALATRRSEEMLKRASLGVETVNEFREELGRDPHPEGEVLLSPKSTTNTHGDVTGEDQNT